MNIFIIVWWGLIFICYILLICTDILDYLWGFLEIRKHEKINWSKFIKMYENASRIEWSQYSLDFYYKKLNVLVFEDELLIYRKNKYKSKEYKVGFNLPDYIKYRMWLKKTLKNHYKKCGYINGIKKTINDIID